MLLHCRVPQFNCPTEAPLPTFNSLLLSQAALQQMTYVRVILLVGRQTCPGFHSDEGKKRSNVRCAPFSSPFPKHSFLWLPAGCECCQIRGGWSASVHGPQRHQRREELAERDLPTLLVPASLRRGARLLLRVFWGSLDSLPSSYAFLLPPKL